MSLFFSILTLFKVAKHILLRYFGFYQSKNSTLIYLKVSVYLQIVEYFKFHLNSEMDNNFNMFENKIDQNTKSIFDVTLLRS